eukprot:scpid93405/ scgid21792/ 
MCTQVMEGNQTLALSLHIIDKLTVNTTTTTLIKPQRQPALRMHCACSVHGGSQNTKVTLHSPGYRYEKHDATCTLPPSSNVFMITVAWRERESVHHRYGEDGVMCRTDCSRVLECCCH